MKFIRLISLLIVLAAFALQVQPAQAHGYIVRSTPQDRSVLNHAPNQVQIWFSEGLEPDFSTIGVFNQSGEQVDLGDGGLDPQNRAKLMVSLPNDLPDGVYLVKLRSVYSSDGHAVSDTLVFWVGEQSGNVETGQAADTAIPLEAIWRVALTLALTIFFGTILMYTAILRPAWGNAAFPLGHLPPRVIRRLSQLVWGSLLTAILMNLLALLQITLSLFEVNLTTVMRDELWNIVLAGTNFGDVWKVRMVILAAMLFIQITAAQQARNRPFSTHILWLVNGGLALLSLSTLSLISHASGSSIWGGVVPVIVDYLHLTAVAAWIGGLIILALIIRPALITLSAAERGQALQAVLKRFSWLAAVSLSLIIVTGIFNSLIVLDAPSNLSQTTYGLTLLSKWILMLPLLALGAIHYIVVSPERLARVAAFLKSHEWFTRLPNTLRLEMLFAVVVMLAGAWLPATPPPIPADANTTTNSSEQNLTVEGYTLDLSLSPAAVGANSYDVRIIPATIESVHLRFYQPAWGYYTTPSQLEAIQNGLWIGASGEINRAGEWDVLIDFTPINGSPIRAAFRWNITEEATKSGSASVWLWLSATNIVLVIVGWGVPLISGRITALNWTPENIAVAVLAISLTIGVTIGGAIVVSQAGERVAERRNQPPEHINPIFPDQSSLEVGRTIYENNCAACHGIAGRGYSPLGVTINKTIPYLVDIQESDEDLFRQLRRGINARHPFAPTLSEEDLWHLINFLIEIITISLQ